MVDKRTIHVYVEFEAKFGEHLTLWKFRPVAKRLKVNMTGLTPEQVFIALTRGGIAWLPRKSVITVKWSNPVY